MSMKVYLVGKSVVIDQTAQPLLGIDRNLAIYRIENDSITIFNNQNRTIFRTDTIANVQDSGGTPIGNLQDVVLYLKDIVIRGTSVSVPTSGGGGGGEANTASNVGAGDGVFKQKTGVDLEFKSLIGGTGITITPNADDITFSLGGAPTEINIVNVLSAGDLPATLLANTAYIVNGSITTSQAISTVGDNAMIIGRKGRNTDKITYTGTGTFINLVDVNFTLKNITLSATDSSSRIIDGDNYSTGSFNEGRDKVISIFTCQFRNCYDVMTINGFDLVDINNTLFFYVQAINHGLEFHSTSKIELSSCELIRWFDESTLPTPGGWALAPMFCIVPDGIQQGVGAVNISGCIMHPQQTQDAIKLDPASTTGFGTISANTFVTAGLTTGVVGNFDYNIHNSYIIQANQSLSNGNAKGTLLLTGNSVYLDNSVTNPIIIKGANTVGGGGFTNPITFPVANRVITSVADGSFTYNSKIDGNFFVMISATVQMTGNGFITIRVRQNGFAFPAPKGVTEIRTGVADSINFSVVGVTTIGDVFDFEVESSSGADVLMSEFVVNGYQF
jgi:hypothetical protein